MKIPEIWWDRLSCEKEIPKPSALSSNLLRMDQLAFPPRLLAYSYIAIFKDLFIPIQPPFAVKQPLGKLSSHRPLRRHFNPTDPPFPFSQYSVLLTAPTCRSFTLSSFKSKNQSSRTKPPLRHSRRKCNLLRSSQSPRRSSRSSNSGHRRSLPGHKVGGSRSFLTAES
jgi:hypothetical protein